MIAANSQTEQKKPNAHLQAESLIFHPPACLRHHEPSNARHMVATQPLEHNLLIEAVEQLRFELLLHLRGLASKRST